MKKFFRFTILSSIFFYLCWFSALYFFPIYFKGIDYVSWNYKFEEIPLKKLHGATIILGDSTAEAALNPSLIETDETVYNLSLPGGTTFDSYVLIKRLINNGVIPKRVFIVFSNHNFSLDDGFIQRNLNYNFYSFSEISEAIEWQRNNEFLYKDLSQFDNLAVYFPYSIFLKDDTNDGKARLSYLEYILSNLRLSLIDYSRFTRWLTGSFKINPEEITSVRKDLKELNGHVNYYPVDFDLAEYPPGILERDFVLHGFTKHFFEKTLKILGGKNIPVVMGYFPVPEYYYKLCSENFKKTFHQLYEDTEKKFNITIEKELPWFPHDHFVDGIHLNKKGAKVFTKIFQDNHF